MFWPEFRRMALSPDVWQGMDRLQREMDRLFAGLSLPYERSFPSVPSKNLYPFTMMWLSSPEATSGAG